MGEALALKAFPAVCGGPWWAGCMHRPSKIGRLLLTSVPRLFGSIQVKNQPRSRTSKVVVDDGVSLDELLLAIFIIPTIQSGSPHWPSMYNGS